MATFNFNDNFKKNIINYLPPSSDSLYISEFYKYNNKKILLITNDAYNLNRIKNEIRTFDDNVKIAIFPDLEILPYEKASPQNNIIAERLETLWKLSNNKVDILIVQSQTILQYLCPKEYLLKSVFIIQVNDVLHLELLKNQLIGANYSFVDNVYEKGEFAIKGSIIDIFPISSNTPIRIELFDNLIENIYLIDKNNKNLSKLSFVELIPPHEFQLTNEFIKTFTNKFKEEFQSSNNDIIKDIANGIFCNGLEFYLPLFYENCCSLLEYIDSSWNIFYFESLNTSIETFLQELKQRYEYLHYQYPCLKPNQIYLTQEIIFTKLKNFKNFIIKETGNLNNISNFTPNIKILNSLSNHYKNLHDFRKSFNGGIIIFFKSLGRSQLIKQNLLSNNFIVENINHIIELKTKSDLNKIYLITSYLENSFIYNNIAYITENDLFEFQENGNFLNFSKNKKNNSNQLTKDLLINDLSEINIGDYIVHVNFGIGKYLGLTSHNINSIEYEMLTIEYEGGSKLFVPIENLHLISKYINLKNINIKIDKLGSKNWENIKNKTEKKINDVATSLLETYAKRELKHGLKCIINEEYEKFSKEFDYEPTPDQEKCFNDIINDLTLNNSQKPMDRLICGDVGFGKTEVAMRATFIVAYNSYQVAIIAPTTLLVEQHYQNFINRFANFPINIAHISRFSSTKEIRTTLEKIKNGQIDIIIGTHRLLQNDIYFKNLGLIIIDEEHRFGVKQKEALRTKTCNVHTLAMTATPIPRTLSMALDGVRDFSIIATPPQKRLPIITTLSNDDDHLITEAIHRELRRGGQLFFLYNDVNNINLMYERLTKLAPYARIAITHGQLPEPVLENTIRNFILQKYNILISSTIIESGIDIPNANTIIIYDADKFGLAQLYQLRGRVGRSHHQAYCYLITKENITNDANKRLNAIINTSELGSGFNLAIHDLEIRGAGEILGETQSGNIKEVGLSLYTQMLKKAIRKLKNLVDAKEIINESNCEVILNVSALITTNYCQDIHKRLVYYKKLSLANNIQTLEDTYSNIINECGIPNIYLNNLFNLHLIRINCQTLGIKKVEAYESNINIYFLENTRLSPTNLIEIMILLKTCKYDENNRKLNWKVANNNDEIKFKNMFYLLGTLKSQIN